jgi:gluconokinase
VARPVFRGGAAAGSVSASASGGEPPFVLAIDVGSSSVRASLYDRHARLVDGSQAARPTSLHTAADGTSEEDPLALAAVVEAVLDDALAPERLGGRAVAAVGLDTLVFAACGVDAAGAPVTPLFTYADTRARHAAQDLRRELDFADVYQRTGCPLHTSYMPARLRWLETEHPDQARQVARWLFVGSLLYARWFGQPVIPVSYSVASWTGLLDRRRLDWDDSLRAHLHVGADALPPLVDYDQAQRGLSPAYATRWPALRDVPFFLAVGDGATANVGSGCVTPDRVALTVGTSGAMRIVVPDAVPRVPAGLWAYKVGVAETLMGGALSEGGNVFAWATATLRVPEKQELDAALRALPPDGHGLTVLPFVAGERSPGWSNDAEAALVGFHPGTTPLEVLQASLEAVCYRFAILARLLSPHAAPTHEIVASGGAMSASPYWVQLLANVLGRRVRLSESAELTSRGTAVLALRALGIWRTLADEPLATEHVYEPDGRLAGRYQAAIERQHRLYAATVGVDPEIGPALDAAVRGR